MEDIKKIVELMFSVNDLDRDKALVLTKEVFGYNKEMGNIDFKYDFTRLFAIEIMRQVFTMYKNDILVFNNNLQDVYTCKNEHTFGGVSGYLFTAVPIDKGFTKSFDNQTEEFDVRFHVSKFIDVEYINDLKNVYQHTFNYNLVIKRNQTTGDIWCEPSIPSLFSQATNDEITYSIDDLSFMRGSYMMTFRNKYDVFEKFFKHFLISK
jgi:hypothetical protein